MLLFVLVLKIRVFLLWWVCSNVLDFSGLIRLRVIGKVDELFLLVSVMCFG